MESPQLCCFLNHSTFVKELEEFINHHCSPNPLVSEALENIQRLLSIHFFRKSPMFTPKHIGQAQGFGGYLVYWIHMVIPDSGLSRTQLPKAYFYKTDSHICFLCLDSHLQNYDDAKLRKVCTKRLEEILEVLKNHECEFRNIGI